jgi:hypothetical protein
MRKIPARLVLLILVLLFAACGSEHERQGIDTSKTARQPTPSPLPAPPPPPLPPLPGSSFQPIPEAQAIAAAKRMGAGDCSDLQRIQALPMKKQYGFDPYYDRIMIHLDAYEPCLLQATASTRATPAETSYPGVSIETIGDLAFALLVDGEKVRWSECTPNEVIVQEREAGSSAFYAWLKTPGAREQWHDCLVRKHGA